MEPTDFNVSQVTSDIVNAIIKSFLDAVIQLLQIFYPLIIIAIAFLSFKFIRFIISYYNGAYYRITGVHLFMLWGDFGKRGEYLTYKKLRHFEKNGAKFLFNVYIPKDNGETSEIDVLMLTTKGIFVFESKNYSGWIFGHENQKIWYQTLPSGKNRSRKEQFYNPIMQNRNHIKNLKSLIGEQIPIYSIIVFSERCTLKNVTVKSCEIKVIKRDMVSSAVSDILKETPSSIMSYNDMGNLYRKLYTYTQIDEAKKAQHISNIKNNLEKEAKTEDIETNSICPKCGGKLVLRTASKGKNIGNKFWGCNNFPKCRFTAEYNDQLKTQSECFNNAPPTVL